MGETLENVYYSINYLDNLDSYRLGECMIVIGAGSAAMDVPLRQVAHRPHRWLRLRRRAGCGQRVLADSGVRKGGELLYPLQPLLHRPGAAGVRPLHGRRWVEALPAHRAGSDLCAGILVRRPAYAHLASLHPLRIRVHLQR